MVKMVVVQPVTGEVFEDDLPRDPRSTLRWPAEIGGPSLTVQSEAAACDINNIMAKYEKTGILEHVNKYQGRYGDFSQVVDYQTALETVAKADEAFMSLPAKVRARFENDPGSFLEFVNDPKNGEELVAMGLAKRRDADPVDRIVDAVSGLGGSEPPLARSAEQGAGASRDAGAARPVGGVGGQPPT